MMFVFTISAMRTRRTAQRIAAAMNNQKLG
jgi:hypothetical protein